MLDLQEKYGSWALVTGASSGIGKAFSQYLVAQKINCLILSNDSAQLEATKLELQQLMPGVQVIAKHVDLADISAVEQLLLDPDLKPARILINCAGIGVVSAILNQQPKFYQDMFNINAIAPFLLSYHFAQKLYQHDVAGAIINISSANAETGHPTPYSAVYTPLKIFLKQFTEALGYEMRDYKVDVLNVACGPTATAFQTHAQTNRLSFCETPEQVAHKAFKALGKKTTVTTNAVSKILIFTFKYLPLTRHCKTRLLAYYFGHTLGGGRYTKLHREKKCK